jgi:hypothetical protein
MFSRLRASFESDTPQSVAMASRRRSPLSGLPYLGFVHRGLRPSRRAGTTRLRAKKRNIKTYASGFHQSGLQPEFSRILLRIATLRVPSLWQAGLGPAELETKEIERTEGRENVGLVERP